MSLPGDDSEFGIYGHHSASDEDEYADQRHRPNADILQALCFHHTDVEEISRSGGYGSGGGFGGATTENSKINNVDDDAKRRMLGKMEVCDNANHRLIPSKPSQLRRALTTLNSPCSDMTPVQEYCVHPKKEQTVRVEEAEGAAAAPAPAPAPAVAPAPASVALAIALAAAAAAPALGPAASAAAEGINRERDSLKKELLMTCVPMTITAGTTLVSTVASAKTTEKGEHQHSSVLNGVVMLLSLSGLASSIVGLGLMRHKKPILSSSFIKLGAVAAAASLILLAMLPFWGVMAWIIGGVLILIVSGFICIA